MFTAELDQMEIYVKSKDAENSDPEGYSYSHNEDISREITARTIKSLLNKVSEYLLFKKNLSGMFFEQETLDEETGKSIVVVKVEYYRWYRTPYTPEQQVRLKEVGFQEYITVSFKIKHDKRGVSKEEVLRYLVY